MYVLSAFFLKSVEPKQRRKGKARGKWKFHINDDEVACSIFAEYNQQDAAFQNLFISVRRFTCFRLFFLSIISSSKLHLQQRVAALF